MSFRSRAAVAFVLFSAMVATVALGQSEANDKCRVAPYETFQNPGGCYKSGADCVKGACQGTTWSTAVSGACALKTGFNCYESPPAQSAVTIYEYNLTCDEQKCAGCKASKSGKSTTVTVKDVTGKACF
jgi:hypothetical protein